MFALALFGIAALLALGIRSYARIARAAREAGALAPGFADSNQNALRIYRRAFTRFNADSVLLILGFGGALSVTFWMIRR